MGKDQTISLAQKWEFLWKDLAAFCGHQATLLHLQGLSQLQLVIPGTFY
jgi:hypothetical protein